MKKIRVTIPYKKNENGKSILLALGAMKDFSSLPFEEIGRLQNRFHDMNDIYYDAPIENITELYEILDDLGFVYEIDEIEI